MNQHSRNAMRGSWCYNPTNRYRSLCLQLRWCHVNCRFRDTTRLRLACFKSRAPLCPPKCRKRILAQAGHAANLAPGQELDTASNQPRSMFLLRSSSILYRTSAEKRRISRQDTASGSFFPLQLIFKETIHSWRIKGLGERHRSVHRLATSEFDSCFNSSRPPFSS